MLGTIFFPEALISILKSPYYTTISTRFKLPPPPCRHSLRLFDLGIQATMHIQVSTTAFLTQFPPHQFKKHFVHDFSSPLFRCTVFFEVSGVASLKWQTIGFWRKKIIRLINAKKKLAPPLPIKNHRRI